MKLPETLANAAMDEAVDRCISIDDTQTRNIAIRRAALDVGAEQAFSLVSEWLAEQYPEVHQAFLAKFKPNPTAG